MELQELISLGISAPVAAALYWLHTRVTNAESKAAKAAADLVQYKLDAADKYASIGYLKDVEERLVRVLERIEDRLNKLGKSGIQ